MRRRLWVVVAAALALARSAEAGDPLFDASRLRIGVGDRLEQWGPDGPRALVEEASERGLPLDYVQVWLTRGWEDSWLDRRRLAQLTRHNVVPVVVHYWFGDEISRERFESDRDAWYGSLWRLSQRVRAPQPVLVVLEPEFNVTPPPGATATLDWPGFGEHLRAAARLIRREAPNARVGVCAGDFPGPPRLERVLGPVADDLDFLAFQEMRAATDPHAGRPGYAEVGRAAVEYSAYLRRAFGRPLLLAYVAVSSHGDREREQAAALEDLSRHAKALRGNGVFGAIYMQLFDDPKHEGYFGPAEKHFGLLRADGQPKPALAVLRSLARREGAGESTPGAPVED